MWSAAGSEVVANAVRPRRFWLDIRNELQPGVICDAR
jgi:hypothetical protein